MAQPVAAPSKRLDLYLGAALLGLLHAVSFAPWAYWPLSLACLAGLFGLLRLARARCLPAHVCGAITGAFGLTWFGAGLSWLFISMHHYGGLPAPLAVAAVLLFAAYLSCFPALAIWLAYRAWGQGGPLTLAMGVTASWTLAELARGHWFTGFPWLAIGYAHVDGPLAGLAPLLGVHGVGAATVLLAALLAALIPLRWPRTPRHAPWLNETTARGIRRVGIALTAVATLLAGALLLPPSNWTTPVGTPLSVRLVQGNVAQHMKFEPNHALAAMLAYTEQFESSHAQLTVLPETAWTVPWSNAPDAIRERVLRHAQEGHALAIGMPFWSAEPNQPDRLRLTNSVLLIEHGATEAAIASAPRYDKHHLVPFGEFIPPGFRWFVTMMRIPLGDFARGAPVQAPMRIGDQTIGFNICYEDLFGEELRSVLQGPNPASILANVSNIAWFGQTHALPQHLAIARMRSLETGRPMLRATNTGVTALIDAQGRVVASLPPHTQGALDVMVQGTTGLTPFVRWGNSPVLIIALALGLLAWQRKRRTA